MTSDMSEPAPAPPGSSFVLEFDGSAGQDGSGCGAILYDWHTGDDRLKPLWQAWCHLAATHINNNATEYEGLSCGLWYLEKELESLGGCDVVVEVRGDSKTVVDHMIAEQYREREAGGTLQQYHVTAWNLYTRLVSRRCVIKFKWQKRDKNETADMLASRAVNSRTDGFERASQSAGDSKVLWRALELRQQTRPLDHGRKRAADEGGDCEREPAAFTTTEVAAAAAATTDGSSSCPSAVDATSAGLDTVAAFEPTISRDVRARMEAQRLEALRRRTMKATEKVGV